MRHVPYCLIALAVSCSLSFSADGTVPRLQAANYPSHTEIDGTGVGAVLLKESEVKSRFAAKLSGEFMVVEVAVYPRKGERLEVDPGSFTLRISGDEDARRPENPRVVASVLQGNGPRKSGVRVIPQARVGIDTGPRYPDPRYDPNYPGYDPTYDPRYDPRYSRGGVYTSTGVGVVLGGGSGQGQSSNKEEVVATELAEKSLPAGFASKPVAGHLYFRVDKKTQQDRNHRFSLELELQGKTAKLELK